MSRLSSLASLAALAFLGAFLFAAETNLAPVPNKTSTDDWPQFRGPKRDGISPDKGLLKEWPKDGPTLVWKSETLGIGFSSVSMVGDRLYTMGDEKDSSYVYALDRNTGKKLWSTKVGKPGGNYAGTRCTPTVDGDYVYALGQFGDLVCLEAATGKEKWRKSYETEFKGKHGSWDFTESPLIDGDKLICTPGGDNSTMVALNKKTGEVIWKAALKETAGYASVVPADIAGVHQYVQTLSQDVVGIDANSGKILWRYGQKRIGGNTANIPNPIVMGDQIFVSVGYGKGGGLIKVAQDGADFKVDEVYFKGELNNRHGGVVIVGDYAYGDTDNSGHVWCAEWKTGKVKWKNNERTEGKGSAAIVYADGNLYIFYDNGYVALVPASPEGYKEVSGFKVKNAGNQSWAHPVVIGGKLYLRERDVVWCYDVTAK